MKRNFEIPTYFDRQIRSQQYVKFFKDTNEFSFLKGVCGIYYYEVLHFMSISPLKLKRGIYFNCGANIEAKTNPMWKRDRDTSDYEVNFPLFV